MHGRPSSDPQTEQCPVCGARCTCLICTSRAASGPPTTPRDYDDATDTASYAGIPALSAVDAARGSAEVAAVTLQVYEQAQVLQVNDNRGEPVPAQESHRRHHRRGRRGSPPAEDLEGSAAWPGPRTCGDRRAPHHRRARRQPGPAGRAVRHRGHPALRPARGHRRILVIRGSSPARLPGRTRHRPAGTRHGPAGTRRGREPERQGLPRRCLGQRRRVRRRTGPARGLRSESWSKRGTNSPRAWENPAHARYCTVSCPDCLRSYDNRRLHGALDWRLALDMLDLAAGSRSTRNAGLREANPPRRRSRRTPAAGWPPNRRRPARARQQGRATRQSSSATPCGGARTSTSPIGSASARDASAASTGLHDVKFSDLYELDRQPLAVLQQLT